MAGETCMCTDKKHAADHNGVHGKVHGTLAGYIHMWHECTGCGTIYCDDCGRSCLSGKTNEIDQVRVCPECGSVTKLF